MSDYDSGMGGARRDPAADVADLRGDAAKLAGSVTDAVKSQATLAGNSVKDALDTARGAIGDTAAQASDRVSSLGAELEATIERNPLTAVLIALSVGLVAGMLTHSRR